MEGHLAGVRLAECGEHLHAMATRHRRSLTYETALTDARRPYETYDCAVTVDGALQQALNGGHLPAPTDQLRLTTPASAMPGAHAQQPMGRHGRFATLDLNQLRFAERCSALNESRRRGAEQHPTRRGNRFHPLRHPNLLTDSGVTEWPRTDLAGDYLTGVQAHSQPQLHGVTVADFAGEPLRLLLDGQCRQAGTDCVVFQCRWRAEHRHDAVAGELVHRPAIALHHRRAPVGEVGHDLPQPLRPNGSCEVHRVHHIGEQHRDLLVLGTGIVRRYRRTTAVTESRTLTRLDGTRAARGRSGHPTLRGFRPPRFPVHQHRALDLS